MNHGFAMGGFQPAHHLDAKLQCGLLRQRLLADFLVEALPGNVLRDQVIDAVLLAEVESHRDVGMIEPADSQRLFAKALTAGASENKSCGRILSATSRRSCSSWARKTTPMPPAPICSISR